MATKQREYQRLSGTGTKLASRAKLWLGADHLLLITSGGYWENYKRFYFRDIQAFVIRPNRKGKIANLIIAGLAVLPLLGALFSAFVDAPPDYDLAGFWGIVAGLLLTGLLINTLLGPTCTCHVKTAVQMEELPSLRRLKRARKVLNYLQPRLVEAQGELAGAAQEPGARLTPKEGIEDPPPRESTGGASENEDEKAHPAAP